MALTVHRSKMIVLIVLKLELLDMSRIKLYQSWAFMNDSKEKIMCFFTPGEVINLQQAHCMIL